MIDGFRRPKRPSKYVTNPAAQHVSQHMVTDGQGPAATPPQNIFQTPDETANADMHAADPDITVDSHAEKPNTKRSFKEWLKDRTKKQWIIFSILAAIVVIGGGIGAYLLLHHPAKKPVVVKSTPKAAVVKPAPQPTTVASNLTGLQVDPSVNLRPVTAVMIENSDDARPQSGLDQAGVVFEAVAEGGITRFVALFQDTAPAYIGPVRSVRPYYLQWLLGFDAPVAHVGGSAEALHNIPIWGVKDLDQFYNGSYYHRISSRYAPHNVYTSMAELNALESTKSFTSSKYQSLERKIESTAKTPGATSIDLTISSADFNVHYDYDHATNTYKRSEGGAPHMELDQNGAQTQIAPKVVVAMVLTQGIASDDLHTAYTTLGSGPVYIFQDGVVYIGTWNKATSTDNFTFKNQQGQPIKLNPGQTWFTAVNSTGHVVFK